MSRQRGEVRDCLRDVVGLDDFGRVALGALKEAIEFVSRLASGEVGVEIHLFGPSLWSLWVEAQRTDLG